MTTKKAILTTLVCGTLIVAAIVLLLRPSHCPRFAAMLYFKVNYNNVHYIDQRKRCLVLEQKPTAEAKRQEGYKPAFEFYDTEKQTYLRLGDDIVINDVREIRPGYYALYGPSGLQDFSIVMPYASEDVFIRKENEIQIISCEPYAWDSQEATADGNELPPADVKEEEARLIELYEQTGQCGDELISYVARNNQTLDYDFDRIASETNVSVLTSDDKNLRFYTWDTGRGGTSPDFLTYVQYRDGKTVAGGVFTPLSSSKYATSVSVRQDGYEAYGSGWITCLHQISQKDVRPIYITSLYNKASSREGEQEAYALKIKNGLLEKTPFVDKDGQEAFSAGCLYYIPEWYFTTDGLGWDWVMAFDSETMTLYIPESGDMEMTDRYDKYRFSDGKMRYAGNGAGFWLHPSLRDFKRLLGIYQTKTKLIRVDLLADGEYRYAAWDKKNAMAGAPELVITGGKTDIVENAIVFEKDDYQYIVPAFRQGGDNDFDKLIIKKNNKVIQRANV